RWAESRRCETPISYRRVSVRPFLKTSFFARIISTPIRDFKRRCFAEVDELNGTKRKIRQNFLGSRRSNSRFLLVDPRARIFIVLAVRPCSCYSRDLGNPVFSKKIIRIAVFLRELSYFRIVQRHQSAILNDRIVLTAFGVNRERRKQEMNVQMTVENS